MVSSAGSDNQLIDMDNYYGRILAIQGVVNGHNGCTSW